MKTYGLITLFIVYTYSHYFFTVYTYLFSLGFPYFTEWLLFFEAVIFTEILTYVKPSIFLYFGHKFLIYHIELEFRPIKLVEKAGVIVEKLKYRYNLEYTISSAIIWL